MGGSGEDRKREGGGCCGVGLFIALLLFFDQLMENIFFGLDEHGSQNGDS